MSWDTLLSILKVDAQERASAEALPPVACPSDGYPLEEGPEGQLHCPFDGWIWDGFTPTQ